MKAFKFWVILLFCGLFVFCAKKKYPDPLTIENDVVYYSKLSIDGKTFEMKAGVDNYYMYSSYDLDSNAVYNYVADLKRSDCSDCSNSLKIQINDYNTSSSAPTRIDSSLHAGTYKLLQGNPSVSYSVQFFPLDFNSTSSYRWDFGDGSLVSYEASPVKIFNKSGKYTVCLTETRLNSCESSICNQQKINASNNFCRAYITAKTGAGNLINFNAVPTGKQPFKYLWNFGNGTSSVTANPSCTYKYRGAYAVTLRVIDANGDTAYANYNGKTSTDNSSCAANYTMSPVQALGINSSLSKIIITWRDDTGTLFTSNSELQPASSNFEILSVSENEKNEKGQPTKKVTAKFNCKLYNGNKAISVDGAEVVVCFAYKN